MFRYGLHHDLCRLQIFKRDAFYLKSIAASTTTTMMMSRSEPNGRIPVETKKLRFQRIALKKKDLQERLAAAIMGPSPLQTAPGETKVSSSRGLAHEFPAGTSELLGIVPKYPPWVGR
jgi:hypothetical protein